MSFLATARLDSSLPSVCSTSGVVIVGVGSDRLMVAESDRIRVVNEQFGAELSGFGNASVGGVVDDEASVNLKTRLG